MPWAGRASSGLQSAGGPSSPGAETLSTVLRALLRAYGPINAFIVPLVMCIASEERPSGAPGERLPSAPAGGGRNCDKACRPLQASK